jgi:hypothetical protein
MKYLLGFLMVISYNAHAGMWELIQVENSGGVYYCLYKLQGTNMTKMIQSKTYCQQYIFD